jgi:hypothetical protein
MPWKECNRMDERLRFVARLLDGEKMAAVCREFSISRKTDPAPSSHMRTGVRHDSGTLMPLNLVTIRCSKHQYSPCASSISLRSPACPQVIKTPDEA